MTYFDEAKVVPTGITWRAGLPWRRRGVQEYHCTLFPVDAGSPVDAGRKEFRRTVAGPYLPVSVTFNAHDDDEAEVCAREILAEHNREISRQEALRARQRRVPSGEV